MTLIYHQFFADLALIYLNPSEVMRLTAIFAEKKLKIFCDINLTQSGWGQLDLYKAFENFRNV